MTYQKQQITDAVVMVRPLDFGFNPETAESNVFQHQISDKSKEQEIRDEAIREYEIALETLRTEGIRVGELVLQRDDMRLPDAVFPNNWFSTHQNTSGEHELVVYPMLAVNRRAERNVARLKQVLDMLEIPVSRVEDLAGLEREGKFLEGTGSMVFDRVHNIAYACVSPRTNIEALDKFCKLHNFSPVVFKAMDSTDVSVYHTNVMLAVGENFVIICMEMVKDETERKKLTESFAATNKEVIYISEAQVQAFCGNVLQLRAGNERKIILSTTAKEAFSEEQLQQLSRHGKIVAVDVHTIESIGGGGIRCMLAEIF